MRFYEVLEEIGGGVVKFDRMKGLGTVPFQMDIDYYGYTTTMTPDQFRKLVPVGNQNPETVDKLMAMDDPVIAPPFLRVRWEDDVKMWQVIDHEGRSRTDYSKLMGQRNIPVDILPYGMKARDITDEMKTAKFIPQTTQ